MFSIKSLFISILYLLSSTAFAGQVRIAVVDTGLNLKDNRFTNILCKDGSKDLTGEGFRDYVGHGTHVAGLIRRQLIGLESKYCLVIIKYYKVNSIDDNKELFQQAIQYAASINLDFVNVSAEGPGYSLREYTAIKITPETKWVIAAGNGGKDLDVSCDVYPVCYNLPNIIGVGNLERDLTHSDTSNYGTKVTAWEMGIKVTSDFIPHDLCKYHCDKRMSGTSMSTAIHTGKLVKELIY